MTTSQLSQSDAKPFLFCMVLTLDQLDKLARHYLGDDFVERTCVRDPAYAFRRSWAARGVDSLILELQAQDGSPRYLYLLDVLPSSDGQPPKATLNKHVLKELWCKLGRPEIWRKVDLVSIPWSGNFGIPEPQWLYPRMRQPVAKYIQEDS
ncbi:hypothetical protein D9758_018583 [Tetrapyrgos nigripes]|uniref:Uncharacterized protein n=1 Tax=Tetrapyrgos nigripes TaxID=182062 RepID=A0A8H5F9G8_9AGAR|nr:hypothetical protein D9758_018583 [Tetrapyrgos nigripes]